MADSGGYLTRPAPSGLADVLEIILAKGIVIDAYARVSLVGIELLTIDARIVIASVDTYLRFAEATNRLDIWEQGGRSLPEALSEGAEKMTATVAAGVVEKKVSGPIHAVENSVEAVANKATDVAEKVVEAITPDATDN
jgi:gas vesicle structural protein